MEGHSVNLPVTTYNCKHFNDLKCKYIKAIFERSDFLFLQEHCLFKSQFSQFNKIYNSVVFTCTSAMDETVPLVGRPHGGCGIFWRSSVQNKVDIIKCKSNHEYHSHWPYDTVKPWTSSI